MIRSLDLTSRPQPAAPLPVIAVDRAIAELRRGQMVTVRDRNRGVTMLAAEAITDDSLARLTAMSGGAAPVLVLTGRRLEALGLGKGDAATMTLTVGGRIDADTISVLADPCADSTALGDLSPIVAAPGGRVEDACSQLAKLARLLPAAVIVPAPAILPEGMMPVAASDILDHQSAVARSLRPVAEARVPLEGAENVRIVAFRPSDGGIEHLAIVIGDPDGDQPVLTRLHSECFTGDLLGSLRCDCGDQLRGAIAEIAAAGSGVLLYLAQEGRGIGLVNKLRAYQLQDQGFDTLDANLQLGFDDDERIYLPAAQMLRLLGIARVRLMTNNPRKVNALARHGLDVIERVPHIFPSNEHSRGYLHTKATRSGHLF